jgi:hypothetical protein
MLAALLNQSSSTKIIAPKDWYKGELGIKRPNMPSHWIII